MIIPGPTKIRRWRRELTSNLYKRFSPREYADILYEKQFGYKIDWQNPRDLNEWINYLSFCTDTHEWSRLSDKIAVRDYVSDKGLGTILIPLYGVWDKAEDIDFNLLPNSFAIKTNHASGNTIVIEDKASANLDAIRHQLKNDLSIRFGIESAEPHYLRIKPKILAEQLLPPPTNIDYKVWCFNGVPYCIMTISDRDIKTGLYNLNVYDLNWHKHPEWTTNHYQNGTNIPKPEKLEEMIQYARILSEGFPQVRIDFYHTSNGIYFGEMTFTSACGRMAYYTKDCLVKMGNKIKEGWNNKPE